MAKKNKLKPVEYREPITNPKFEKTFFIDISIIAKSDQLQYDRYNAVIDVIARNLRQKGFGTYSGRETGFTKKDKKIDVTEITNFFFVLESKRKEAKDIVNEAVKNFNISKFVIIVYGDALHSDKDYVKEFSKNKQKPKRILKKKTVRTMKI